MDGIDASRPHRARIVTRFAVRPPTLPTRPSVINSFQIQTISADHQESLGSFHTSVELGRQRSADEPLLLPTPLDDATGQRIAVVPRDLVAVARRQVRLELTAANAVRVTNLSQHTRVQLGDGRTIASDQPWELEPPFSLLFGEREVMVCPDWQTLEAPTVFRHRANISPPSLDSHALANLSLDATQALVRWFNDFIALLQSATHSAEFFDRAVEALVDLMQMDAGGVFMLDAGEWVPMMDGLPAFAPSQSILNRVQRECRTFWTTLDGQAHPSQSAMALDAVVAAPILHRDNAVAGVLYGHRRKRPGESNCREITKLEAMLVEMLACGVATGLAHVEQEKAALAAQIRFEQFFSPKLSQHLSANPRLLDGVERNVSVLFCDIRGFSAISEKIGPRMTTEWISSVLTAFSACVTRHEGVLVDYIGDELMAMWGAPADQPDHAVLACQAALEMLAALPALNTEWEAQIGHRTQVGIGINSGWANVGNTGSKQRFKYGPLGPTVNLASRVQGATKYFRSSLLITRATRDQWDDHLPTRRLGQVKVINMGEPVELYELPRDEDDRWAELCRVYEEALTAFENQQCDDTASLLGTVLQSFPDDRPSLMLLARASSG